MKLLEARILFAKLRSKSSCIEVNSHAWRDHPERRFSADEILSLIMLSSGKLQVNPSPEAVPGSFLFHCKDLSGLWCKFSIKFEERTKGEIIIIINAYRKI